VQFVVFHLGVVMAITMSFVIADFATLMDSSAVVVAFQAFLWAAFTVGLMRIVRRVGSKYMRAISSPDDYFSLILLTVWFGLAALAAPFGAAEHQAAGEEYLIAYYAIQTFFLLYVPFSKISHYLYYPFTRYYLGKTLGRRGVYPMQRRPV
jgi:nitrate reductase gamma subunit